MISSTSAIQSILQFQPSKPNYEFHSATHIFFRSNVSCATVDYLTPASIVLATLHGGSFIGLLVHFSLHHLHTIVIAAVSCKGTFLPSSHSTHISGWHIRERETKRRRRERRKEFCAAPKSITIARTENGISILFLSYYFARWCAAAVTDRLNEKNVGIIREKKILHRFHLHFHLRWRFSRLWAEFFFGIALKFESYRAFQSVSKKNNNLCDDNEHRTHSLHPLVTKSIENIFFGEIYIAVFSMEEIPRQLLSHHLTSRARQLIRYSIWWNIYYNFLMKTFADARLRPGRTLQTEEGGKGD